MTGEQIYCLLLPFGRCAVSTPLGDPRLFIILMRTAQTRISKGVFTVRDSTYKTCSEKSRFYMRIHLAVHIVVR
jgi:hypothetical protein